MTPVEHDAPAWQPLTPRGVAAFARASWRRLLAIQFVFAIVVAATVGWFLHANWFPAVREAIRRLPETGEIRAGELVLSNAAPQALAEGHFLALSVDPDHAGAVRLPAHVQVEFGRRDVWIHSLLGYRAYVYPPDRRLAFNRAELEPWWGAWSPPILSLAMAAWVAGLMAMWLGLGIVYAVPVWLAGFFANRDLNLAGGFKLAGAALMPGALFLAAVIVVYGLGALDLVQLGAGVAAHLVIGWICLFLGVLFTPRLSSEVMARKNPFARE